MATSEAKQGVGLTWEEVCNDPHLQDLPYKVELNEWGQIVMSPTYLWHGKAQVQIAQSLQDQLPTGEALVEAAIQTSKGRRSPT